MSPSKTPSTSTPAPDAAAEQPEPVRAADPTTPDDAAEVADDDAPLNRADRRAKAKGLDPSHVGPRAGRTAQGRSARSHTKRQLS